MAKRRPNSTSSSLWRAVPACCISVIVAIDSSYALCSLPVANSKTRTLRSGNEKDANWAPDGDTVIEVGRLLAFLNVKRSVDDLSLNTFSGFSNVPCGCQYSIIPLSSAEIAQS